jgi:hypothetical protein
MVARGQYRVVGFLVQPSSRAVTLDAAGAANCDTDRPLVVNESEETTITYTYNVEWRVCFSNLNFLMTSIPIKNGRRDGISIYMWLIPEFIGSVLLTLLSLLFSSLEWLPWFFSVRCTRISQGNGRYQVY